MNTNIEQIIVVHGTVRDLLNVAAFVNPQMQERLFDQVRTARNLDQEIRLTVSTQEEADIITNLSRFAEKSNTALSVASKSRPNTRHTIFFKGGVPISCSCESFTYSNADPCKHMIEVSMRKIRPPQSKP